MEKISTVPWFHSLIHGLIDSMLMIEPYPTPKPNPTAKPNHIPCPNPIGYLKYRIEFISVELFYS